MAIRTHVQAIEPACDARRSRSVVLRGAIFVSAVLAFALAMQSAAPPATAGTGPAVSIGSAVDTAGQDATVVLQALDIAAPGLGAWQIDIQYDPNILTPLSCLGQAGGVCNPNFGVDTVRVTGASGSGLVGDTTLAQIQFGCDIAGISALTLTLVVFSDAAVPPQPISATIVDGTFECRVDTDLDGCADAQETGLDALLGGLRDPNSFWDFYDVPAGAGLERDQQVSSIDIFAVIGRFGTSGDPGIDPLTPPPPTGYHTAYDRGGVIGTDVWDLGPADGSIASTDIFGVLGQFTHSCA